MGRTPYNVGKYQVSFGDESALSKTYDPNTGSGTYSGKQQDLINQFNTGGLSDAEQMKLIEGQGGKIFNPTASPTTASGVVTSTSGIRADQDTVRNDANQLITGVGDLDDIMNQQLDNVLSNQSYGETDAGQQSASELDQLRRDLGLFNASEEQQITDAGTAAAGGFSGMIQEAEDSKRQGLPKATIAGGERGGFMNTQVAGGAALQTTEGGTFRGEGGELKRIESVYDSNISNLKVQAQNAKLAAEGAARQAIRTGKRQDYDLAIRAADSARQSHNEALKLANEKVEAISGYLSNQTNRDINIINTLKNIPEGESVNIGGVDYKGLAPEEINAFFKSSDLVSLMKALPEGETKEIKDPGTGETYTITGLKSDDPNTKTFESEDASGNVTYTTIDSDTGEIVKAVEAGRIGKGRAPKSTTDTSGLTKEETAFQKEKNSIIDQLATGDVDWAEAYNLLTGKYPETHVRLTEEDRAAYNAAPEDETIADVILNKTRYKTE